MASLTLLIFIMSCLSSALQMTFIEKTWAKWGWYLILAAFVYIAHTYAIEQSYELIKAQLADKEKIINFVVLLIIEASLGFMVALNLIDNTSDNKYNKMIFSALNKAIGITIFIALFYFECFGYFSITSKDFKIMALAMAVIFPLAVFLLEKLFRAFISEKEQRIDLKILIHLIQFIGGIVLSIIVLRLPVSNRAGGGEIAIKGLAIFTAIALLCFVTGYKLRLRSGFRQKK